MQEKDKHNLYSKEELLKILKEGKDTPADMDAFEQEALDGLRLLDNPDILDTLNKQVDEIIDQEKNKKRAVFYLSAAASLLLIIGLFFFFKNFSDKKENTVLAEKTETSVSNENKHPVVNSAKEKISDQTQAASEPKVSEKPVLLAEETKKTKPNKEEDVPKPVASKPLALQSATSFVAQNEEVKPTLKEEERTNTPVYEEAATMNLDTKSDTVIDKEQFQHLASKNANSIVATQSGVIIADRDVSKQKKESDGAIRLQVTFSAANTAQASSPTATEVAAKKSNTNLFYSNSADKNMATKKYTEPSFIGGDSAFAIFVKQNLKISSPAYSGFIVLKFMVNKNGTSENIEVIEPLKNCPACSEDAINFIKSIQKWQPALMDGDTITAPKKIRLPYN